MFSWWGVGVGGGGTNLIPVWNTEVEAGISIFQRDIHQEFKKKKKKLTIYLL